MGTISRLEAEVSLDRRPFDTALVASSSAVLREVLDRFLRVWAGRRQTVSTFAEARIARERLGEGDLFVLDADLESGDPEALVRTSGVAAELGMVLVLSGHDEVFARGARRVITLRKPVSLNEISRYLRTVGLPAASSSRRFRRRPVALAVLVDPTTNAHCAEWEIHDISLTGAFVSSLVSYAPGTALDLEIHVQGHRIRLRARVVRCQPPDWTRPAGIGVCFEPDAAATEALAAALARECGEPHAAPILAECEPSLLAECEPSLPGCRSPS